MANLHEFLVNELDASQTRRLEKLDLRLDEQIERRFRHEQARPGARRVTNGRSDVLGREVVGRIDGFERTTKDVVEDVVDTRAAAKLLC